MNLCFELAVLKVKPFMVFDENYLKIFRNIVEDATPVHNPHFLILFFIYLGSFVDAVPRRNVLED